MKMPNFGRLFERKDKTPERIQSAAIRYQGEIFMGATHHEALEELQERHSDAELMSILDEDQGWVTTRGRYVTREKALEIAALNDQIRPEEIGDERLDSDGFKP